MKTLLTILFFLPCSILFSNFNPEYSGLTQGFEENRGQLADFDGSKADEVLFYTMNKDVGVYITAKGVSYVIYRYEEMPQAAGGNDLMSKYRKEPKPSQVHYSRIDIDLLNAEISKDEIECIGELPGYSNYYYGHAPDGILYVKSYNEVRIKNVYKSIDWLWRYDNSGVLHHEFVLSPDANTEDIRLKVKYADFELTADGKKLILSTPLGRLEDGWVLGHSERSVVFPIEVKYVVNEDGIIGYAVENWARQDKLIIDPPLSLTWATFYGGSAWDIGISLATDGAGNVFVTGETGGGTFPLHNPGGGAYFQGTHGGGDYDAFMLKFGDGVIGVTPIGSFIPESFKLHQNYPNPFNPVTKINFDIAKESDVRIAVYDVKGQLVSELVNQRLKASSYEATFNGSNLSSGVYFYTITTRDFKDTKRMILVK